MKIIILFAILALISSASVPSATLSRMERAMNHSRMERVVNHSRIERGMNHSRMERVVNHSGTNEDRTTAEVTSLSSPMLDGSHDMVTHTKDENDAHEGILAWNKSDDTLFSRRLSNILNENSSNGTPINDTVVVMATYNDELPTETFEDVLSRLVDGNLIEGVGKKEESQYGKSLIINQQTARDKFNDIYMYYLPLPRDISPVRSSVARYTNSVSPQCERDVFALYDAFQSQNLKSKSSLPRWALRSECRQCIYRQFPTTRHAFVLQELVYS